ncbi:MAG TPA: chemotaxis protein CheB [Solirubrobacter sp.]|nr:chemotaxis protein CheB [Solirubrobacter sp.]
MTGDRIVALVASAGGVEAVSRIVTRLPADFGASVIVLIHQQPDRTSRLVEILSRRATMPVVVAEHGAELLPRQVIVIPPGRHLLVAPDRRAVLIKSGAAPPNRPSADLLLATLATAVGSRAIAVILSGGGHDGATGATAVHACGGTVIATDEASSTYYSMPLAAVERDDTVDHIVGLDEVAGLLVALTGE